MYEVPELEVGVVPIGQTTALRRGAVAEPVVDYVNSGVDEVVDDASGEREVDEAGEPGLSGGRVHRHRSGGGGYGGGTMGYTGVCWL